jgi:hypothetical protein
VDAEHLLAEVDVGRERETVRSVAGQNAVALRVAGDEIDLPVAVNVDRHHGARVVAGVGGGAVGVQEVDRARHELPDLERFQHVGK